MRKIYTLIVLLAVMLWGYGAKAQVSVSSAIGQTVSALVNSNFVGSGVELITNNPLFPAQFNGSTTVTSNQIGTFSNANTTAPNMPIDAGIVIVTGNCTDAGAGGSTTASSSANSQYTSAALQSIHTGTQSMNDVGSLSFYVRPLNGTILFKYCFASEEYPDYVCSTFNDIFGLFISGPYDETTGQLDTTTGYNNFNIALLPPDYTTAVKINTVNPGSGPGGNTSGCESVEYTNLYVSNSGSSSGNCQMNGYTTELTTMPVKVGSCQVYKLEFAICDIGDQAFNSAVYVKANSLRTLEASLESVPATTNGYDSITDDGYYIFYRGCSTDTILVQMSFPSDDAAQYNIRVEPKVYNSMEEGIDYSFVDINGLPSVGGCNIAAGDSVGYIIMNMLRNDDLEPGKRDTLYIVPADASPCSTVDTIKMILIQPDEIEMEITPNEYYDTIIEPITRTISYKIDNVIRYLVVEWDNNHGGSGIDTLYVAPSQYIGSVEDSMEVTFTHRFVQSFIFTDSCGNNASYDLVFKNGRESIEDVEFKENFTIYPNPTKDQITVKGQDIKQIELIDLQGKVLLVTDKTIVDLKSYAKGEYILRVTDSNDVSRTTKIFKN